GRCSCAGGWRGGTPDRAPGPDHGEPVVRSVRRVGVIGSVAARRAGAISYGGGWSIPFGRDEMLWVFDDTAFGVRGVGGDDRVAPTRSHSALLASRSDWRGAGGSARWRGGRTGRR